MKKTLPEYRRILKIVEGLIICWENSRKRTSDAEAIISDIYTVVHSASDCCGDRVDLAREKSRIEARLKKGNII